VKTSRIIIAASLLVLAVSLYLAGDFGTSDPFTARTISVTDGDTLDVSHGGRNVTVRLLGVDTPETYSPNNPEEFGLRDTLKNRECLERWGRRATDFVKNEIAGENVSVVTDPESDRRGTYGRLLAYIETGNSQGSLNLELVSEGYGRLYESDFSRIQVFREAEKDAIEKEIGVWSC
jgi:micrococcal nuclease